MLCQTPVGDAQARGAALQGVLLGGVRGVQQQVAWFDAAAHVPRQLRDSLLLDK